MPRGEKSPSPSRISRPNIPVASAQTGIQIQNLTFAHARGVRVFDNLTFCIPPAAHVAIIGRSGVGKTTLVRLIAGELTPAAGTISVHGQNPHAARNVAVVEQTPHIFNTTLRENLLVANGHATDDQIKSALRSVGLSELLDRKDGLDLPLVLDGKNVSGGQRQRIALARALLANAPAIVLDEPFAAIDPALEARLTTTLHNAFEGKTLICITHHKDNLKTFDQVIEMH